MLASVAASFWIGCLSKELKDVLCGDEGEESEPKEQLESAGAREGRSRR
jgi:hypothetical protein